jgi:hypothetical protein
LPITVQLSLSVAWKMPLSALPKMSHAEMVTASLSGA